MKIPLQRVFSRAVQYMRPKAEPGTVKALRRELSATVKAQKTLEAQVQHLSAVADPDYDWTNAADNERSGNPYRTHAAQVAQLKRMYLGQSDWGCQFAQAIPTIRSFFTLGNGVKVKIVSGKEDDPKAEKTKEKAEEFLRANGLLGGNKAQKWGKQAAIEGKACARLYPPPKDGKGGKVVDVRFLPWLGLKYKIETPSDDYETYSKLTYKIEVDGTQDDQNVDPPEFSYMPFGGLVNDVNNTPPLMGAIIKQMQDLDKLLYLWAVINDLYASPTPITECELGKDAKTIRKELFPNGQSPNFKTGKWMIMGAKGIHNFYMEVSAHGGESIEKNIITLAKIVSGGSGVPVQFLGLPDLLSNRSTADNLLEQIAAMTHDDRMDWKALFTDVIRKALVMYGNIAGLGNLFDPELVEADIPMVSSAQLHLLTQSYLPMNQSGILSNQTLRELVPGIDPKVEAARVKAEQKEEMALEAVLGPGAGQTPGPGGNGAAGRQKPATSTSNNGGRNF